MFTLVNVLILILVLTLMTFLYFSISQRCKKRLYNIVVLEGLLSNQLRVQPISTKHVFKFIAAYIFLIGIIVPGLELILRRGISLY
ncbi:DUF443 family protein [Oceanobacillus iheyensis]|uniref:DUF443 family protein n=1 Tax=Oceanobacillus iheyensis TaxID=182710 RepID=UPI0038B2ED11